MSSPDIARCFRQRSAGSAFLSGISELRWDKRSGACPCLDDMRGKHTGIGIRVVAFFCFLTKQPQKGVEFSTEDKGCDVVFQRLFFFSSS